MDGLTEGRVVHYVLSDQDAEQINRRRVAGAGYAENWPAGAQAHMGNKVMAGEHHPAMVVRLWSGSMVNLQVLLDGNDQYWATSVDFAEPETLTLRSWHWIEKA